MPHISFSELKNWNTCPWYHKLVNLDKIKVFQGNEYTAFGTAMHTVCEQKLLDASVDEVELFELSLLEELKKLPQEIIEGLDRRKIEDMRSSGRTLAPIIIPQLKSYFSEGFEVLSTEEDLMVPIVDFTLAKYDFKGFIDLVVKTPDNKIHIIDWKTCSWGWDTRRKSDPMTTYQLVYYKNYYAKKHNINPSNIETYFALLKRTAKNNNVEIFRVTSGPKKTKNSLNLLRKAVINIDNNVCIKNRLSCRRCEFYKTEHCK